MSKRIHKRHQERDSAFFRLNTKVKLASLLFTSLEKLQWLAATDNLYFDFKKPKASGGFRDISAPRDDLKAVQSRIAELLHRIVPPEYLFAPVGGRSYVDNAARYIGAQSVHLLDVEDFFPSCTANKVIWFFHKRMQCPPDIAAILRGIVTRNGVLPQGSPCSPILAYLCYVDMWDAIALIVKNAGCTLSVYADDLTISGELVPEAAIWEIKKTLRKHGHKYKVSKERSKYNKPAEITGVILKPTGLQVPNRQHKKMHEVREALSAARSPNWRLTLQAQLRGRRAQMEQITSVNKSFD